jgi:hypothetical protein
VLDGHVEVGDGLRLHALRGVYDEKSSLAGINGARDLVAEVDVPRRVNQVEHVAFSLVVVFHLDGVALDGDATLPLQIHIVQHLPVCHLDGIGVLEQAVGKG